MWELCHLYSDVIIYDQLKVTNPKSSLECLEILPNQTPVFSEKEVRLHSSGSFYIWQNDTRMPGSLILAT